MGSREALEALRRNLDDELREAIRQMSELIPHIQKECLKMELEFERIKLRMDKLEAKLEEIDAR